jgi:hypothetical protein
MTPTSFRALPSRKERRLKMVGPKKKKEPDKAFTHSDDCKILAADPGVEIQWSEIERGHWVAECVCGTEHYHDPVADRRVRLDPLDPATSGHLPQCEFVAATDPAVLKVLLKARERDGYWWVECGSCEAGWQVPFYAGSIGARR